MIATLLAASILAPTATIKVFVVKSEPTLSEDDIAKYCRHNLTGYKVPKYIEFRDDLPKTNVGKILRRELRAGK